MEERSHDFMSKNIRNQHRCVDYVYVRESFRVSWDALRTFRSSETDRKRCDGDGAGEGTPTL